METIIINKLGEYTNNYEFLINKSHSGIYIYIPGHGINREGPIDPNYPEQKKWMQEHSNLKEVWYLTWECKNQQELEEFLQKLENLKTT